MKQFYLSYLKSNFYSYGLAAPIVLLFIFRFFPSAIGHWPVIMLSLGVVSGVALVCMTLLRFRLFPAVVLLAKNGSVSDLKVLGQNFGNLIWFDGLQLLVQWLVLPNLIAGSLFFFTGDDSVFRMNFTFLAMGILSVPLAYLISDQQMSRLMKRYPVPGLKVSRLGLSAKAALTVPQYPRPSLWPERRGKPF